MSEENLEQILKQVERLKSDLIAERIVQEEIGHSEPPSTSWGGPDVYITEQSEIREPDFKKREEAREKLQNISNFSPWYSARFVSKKALGDEPFTHIYTWLYDLEKQYKAEIVLQEEKGHYEIVEEAGMKSREVEVDYTYLGVPITQTITEYFEEEKEYVIDQPRKIKPDKEKRKKAKKDLEELRRELKRSGSFYTNEKSEIEKILGYSPLRIWAQDNPTLTTVSAIGTAATLAIGYFLYQYLSR